MFIQLIREGFTDKATEGVLYVNGTFMCHTLEDMDRKLEDGGEKVYGKTAIPRGTYQLDITRSNRFGKDLILVREVPGFTGIRIHPGNSAKDTDGCILVGKNNKSTTDNWIGNSRTAYNEIHNAVKDAIARGEEVTLEIV